MVGSLTILLIIHNTFLLISIPIKFNRCNHFKYCFSYQLHFLLKKDIKEVVYTMEVNSHKIKNMTEKYKKNQLILVKQCCTNLSQKCNF